MNLQQIIDMTRMRMNNYEQEYKWSDDELVFYADLAIQEWCRETKCLLDHTTTSTSRISTVVDTLDYALSAVVVYVYSVKLNLTAGYKTLIKSDVMTMDSLDSNWRNATHGEPSTYILDYAVGYLTLHPKPDAIYSVHLEVARTPITAFSKTAMSSQTPEIQAQYHSYLVDGIAYQAYLKPGENTYDPKKSQTHFQLFRQAMAKFKAHSNMYIGERPSGPHPGFI
jgi:hypothetical protein